MFPDDAKQSNALKRKMNRGGGSSEKSSAAKSAPRAAAKKSSSSSAGVRGGGGGRGGRGPRRVDDFGFDGGERTKEKVVDQRFFDGGLNHVAGSCFVVDTIYSYPSSRHYYFAIHLTAHIGFIDDFDMSDLS